MVAYDEVVHSVGIVISLARSLSKVVMVGLPTPMQMDTTGDWRLESSTMRQEIRLVLGLLVITMI